MDFHRDRVIDLVTEFYRAHGADEGTKYVVLSNLDDAVRVAEVHGPDSRLADALTRSTARSVQAFDSDRHILAMFTNCCRGRWCNATPPACGRCGCGTLW
jgi:hypothetical protein